MKRFNKMISLLMTGVMSVTLCAGASLVSFAAGGTVSAEVQGSYVQKTEEQDITVRINVSGLSDPYCNFAFDGGTTVPDGFQIKSFSTSNAAQAINGGDYNLANGKLTYQTSDMEDTIPVDTYYEMVVTAPANAVGDYEFVFGKVTIDNQYCTNNLLKVESVTAKLNIAQSTTPATPGYTVALSSDAPSAGVAKGSDFNVNLDVSNTEATTFNAFSGTLTYDKTKVSYTGNDTINEFGVENDSNAGTLKITRANQDVDISKEPDLSLPFKANAAGDAVFELTSAKVDKAANAETQDAPSATVSGSPLTVKVLETYTITFAGGDGATGTAPTMDPAVEGHKFALPEAGDLKKEGFAFSGWNDGTDNYKAGAEYTMPAKDVTFTAQWTENVTVTPASADPSAYFGSQYKLIAATINAEGYVPTYDGDEMYLVQGYDDNTYYYVINGTYDSSKFGYKEGTATTIAKPDYDVNQTNLVDINDAQFVYNIYNGISPTQNIVQRLLLADTNRDQTVGTQDCAVVVQNIA